MENVIKVSDKLSDLTGVGTEYLAVDGFVIARFYNGNFMADPVIGNEEPTIKAA